VHGSKISGFLAEWPRGVEEDEGYFGVCADERLEESRRGSGKEEIRITQAGVELNCYKVSVTRAEQNISESSLASWRYQALCARDGH
jgi:hypothetical protein